MDNILQINPQIILLFDKNGDVERTVFLSYGDVVNDSYVYSFYVLNKNILNFLREDYTIIQDHIPLTYNIEEVRGHISYILKIDDEPIVVYSPYNDIDYSHDELIAFNPFIIENETSIIINDNNSILYNVYKKNLTSGAIFCVVRGKDIIIKNIGRYGTFNISRQRIIYNIIKNIFDNKYISTNTIKDNEEIELENSLDLFLNTLKIKIKKSLIWNYKGDTYISGNEQRLHNINRDDILVVFYDDKYNKVLKINNNILEIYNNEQFNNIREKYPNIFTFKNVKNKTIVVINFETYLNTSFKLDFDFNFFVELKKGTQNIFSDRTSDIQIIISKDHISFRSNIYNDVKLYEYFTAIFLGYSHIINKPKKNRTDIKINQLYTSRYCQNTKTRERKPRIILEESLDLSEYNRVHDRFYEGKIICDKKVGDVYIDKNRIFYKCFDPIYPFISFVSNFVFSVSNVDDVPCIPCCFAKNKSNSEVFNRCILGEINIEERDSIYIQDYGRIVTNTNKSTFLPPELDCLLNKKSDVKYSLQKKIMYANKYSIVKKCDLPIDNIQVENFNDIYNLGTKYDCIIIENKNTIYINPKTLEKYLLEKIKLYMFIIVQKRIHLVKSMTKNKDVFFIENIGDNKIELLINIYFKNLYNEKIIKHDKQNDLILTNHGFYHKKKKLEILENITLFKLPNIDIEKDSTSDIIYKYYSDYFEHIYSEDNNFIINTFVLNAMLNINETNKLNTLHEKNKIIEKLDKYNY